MRNHIIKNMTPHLKSLFFLCGFSHFVFVWNYLTLFGWSIPFSVKIFVIFFLFDNLFILIHSLFRACFRGLFKIFSCWLLVCQLIKNKSSVIIFSCSSFGFRFYQFVHFWDWIYYSVSLYIRKNIIYII